MSDNRPPPKGASTPRLLANKASTSSLASSLSAHLSKPSVSAAIRSSTSPSPEASTSSPNSTKALPVAATTATTGAPTIGKAGPTTGSGAVLTEAASDVWKTSAAKRAEKAWAVQSERALQADAKFKKHAAAVDRALATFESVSEWADFISFLTRLQKTLQAAPHFNAIPKKLIVAKRLSQCLNPALPSGVHQKALDVYAHILTVIGVEGLRRDLTVWTPGLLPFFASASTSVKPALLAVIERYYLPLKDDVRPITKALLLALLPGLEEETGEFFDRVLALLDDVSDSVGRPFLLQNIWLVLISAPSVRLAALNYLARRLPPLKGKGGQEVQDLVGKDLGLMMRAFAASLEDEVLLVRRAALDLIVVQLAVDEGVFATTTREADRTLLVRAAINVVLRRDLSLNRRLYAWLLGPSEEPSKQIEHFQTHALGLVCKALHEDLWAPSPDVSDLDDKQREAEVASRQRPFRVFISLLDKWEIGQPLTGALALDAFAALKAQVEELDKKGPAAQSISADLLTTARMLFEVLDPFALYRQFVRYLGDDVRRFNADEGRPNTVSLLRFLLRLFRVHDDESKQIHMPTLFAVVVEAVGARLMVRMMMDSEMERALLEGLRLALDVLELIPERVFARIKGEKGEQDRRSFAEDAATFYDEDDGTAEETAASRYVGFQDAETQERLLDILAGIAINAHKAPGTPELLTAGLNAMAELLTLFDAAEDAIVAGVDEESKEAPPLDWDASRFGETALDDLTHRVTLFAHTDALVTSLLAAHSCRALARPFSLRPRDNCQAAVRKLLSYLSPDAAPYHVRAAELLWQIEAASQGHHMESILCAEQLRDPVAALDAFGALWRHSDDASPAFSALHAPLLRVLDGMRSNDWWERQRAEMWLRTNLRSYVPIVDALLPSLLESAASSLRRPTRVAVPNASPELSFDHAVYQRPFDADVARYALSTLTAVCRFGAGSFTKALRSANVASSPRITAALATAKLGSHSTYLDVLSAVLVAFLRSDAAPTSDALFRVAVTDLHALSVELLQLLVLRGSWDAGRLAELETVLLERILMCVAWGVHEPQSKLLHALHTVVSARGGGAARRGSLPLASAPPHPLLLRAITAGLTTPSNRSSLQHWTDFILTTVPLYPRALNGLLLPVNECACALVREGAKEFRRAYADRRSDAGDVSCRLTEADVTLSLNIVEKTLLQCLELGGDASVSGAASVDEENSGPSAQGMTPAASTQTLAAPTHASHEKPAETTTGLLGYVSGVFSDSAPQTPTSGSTPSTLSASATHVLRSLHATVAALHDVWLATSTTAGDEEDPRTQALLSAAPKARNRCRRAFERLYRSHSGEVVEALIDCWSGAESKAATFEILNLLTPGSQILATFLCDVLSTRTSRRSATPAPVSNATLFLFLDAYLARLDGAGAVQVWPVVINLVKEVISSSSSHKAHLFPLLRCFTTIGERLATSTALNDDRRMRRDLTDNYVKLVDLCVLIAGRAFDQSTWIRRSTKDGSETFDEPPDEEKLSSSVQDVSTSPRDSINAFLASRAIPALRKFGIDNDKILSLLANVTYYVVSPALRTKGRAPPRPPAAVLDLLSEMARVPGSLKSWRTPVGEAFGEASFFSMSPEQSLRWQPVIFSLLSTDKERFADLLAKLAPPSSANIFTNRDAEALGRALNLRRIATALLGGERDFFLPQLPSMQERVVDILRGGGSDRVVMEVYVFLRVLLLRFSVQHLASFWPVVITEMTRLLEDLVLELPTRNESLQLILSACKFLDLLLVLQTDDFQIYSWLFVTDTIDVVYPPADWISDSLTDRVAAKISSSSSRTAKSSSTSAATPSGSRHRRPLLAEKREISSIDELQPFFASVAITSYEASYVGHEVDVTYVERTLREDMFSGEE